MNATEHTLQFGIDGIAVLPLVGTAKPVVKNINTILDGATAAGKQAADYVGSAGRHVADFFRNMGRHGDELAIAGGGVIKHENEITNAVTNQSIKNADNVIDTTHTAEKQILNKSDEATETIAKNASEGTGKADLEVNPFKFK